MRTCCALAAPLRAARLAVGDHHRRGRGRSRLRGLPLPLRQPAARAYTLVGYTPERDFRYIEINRRLRELHPRIVAEVVAAMQRLGGTIRRDPKTELLTVNDEFTVSLVIARASPRKPAIRAGPFASTSVSSRSHRRRAHGRGQPRHPRLLSAAGDRHGGRQARLADDNGIGLDAFRFASLDYLFGMAERVHARACLSRWAATSPAPLPTGAAATGGRAASGNRPVDPGAPGAGAQPAQPRQEDLRRDRRQHRRARAEAADHRDRRRRRRRRSALRSGLRSGPARSLSDPRRAADPGDRHRCPRKPTAT